MNKVLIEPFPNSRCLSIFVLHKDHGPVGSKHGNPPIGWGILFEGKQLNLPPFKNSKEAKKLAEEIFAVKGWLNSGMAPYHHCYAIPADPVKVDCSVKYRSIDAK